MGGFTTIVAKLARSHIRPLLLRPPTPTSNPSGFPSLLKMIYDVLGVVLTMFILNYSASPFILLSTRESLVTWSRLGWYGHVVVMGGLVFFYGGGIRFLRRLQRVKGVIIRDLPPTNSVRVSAAVSVSVSVRNGVSSMHVSEKMVTTTLPPLVDTSTVVPLVRS